MSKKVKLIILALSSNQPQITSFALVLGEAKGKRRLPMMIGMPEAHSIAMELEQIHTFRPMTHDLFKAFIRNFDVELKEIFISDLKEGIFYAQLICRLPKGYEYVKLDARPSDAIAIAVRCNVPIYIHEDIIEEVGVDADDESIEEITSSATAVHKRGQRKKSSKKSQRKKSIAEFSTAELNTLLKEAIDRENYEEAATIRDELSKRQ